MSVILRLMAIFLAYILACITASLVLTIGTLTPHWDDLASLGLQSAAVWVVVAVGAAIIGAVAMLPTLLIVALAEGFAWRSVILYGALGGVLALALCYGMGFAGYIGEPDSFLAREREVLAAAGIAGGLVYWLFAGRRAGAWK
ncbi:MAG: hypothetical protein P4L80_03655 [Xanthobacteraceae bacterium]|nr:hypothetical protein [Xanthobacteraceae bacterium]